MERAHEHEDSWPRRQPEADGDEDAGASDGRGRDEQRHHFEPSDGEILQQFDF